MLYTEMEFIACSHTFGVLVKAGVLAGTYVTALCIYTYMFLMRDEKEERKKQARSN